MYAIANVSPTCITTVLSCHDYRIAMPSLVMPSTACTQHLLDVTQCMQAGTSMLRQYTGIEAPADPRRRHDCACSAGCTASQSRRLCQTGSRLHTSSLVSWCQNIPKSNHMHQYLSACPPRPDKQPWYRAVSWKQIQSCGSSWTARRRCQFCSCSHAHREQGGAPNASQAVRPTMLPKTDQKVSWVGCPWMTCSTFCRKMVNSVMPDASFSSDSPSSVVLSRDGPPSERAHTDSGRLI